MSKYITYNHVYIKIHLSSLVQRYLEKDMSNINSCDYEQNLHEIRKTVIEKSAKNGVFALLDPVLHALREVVQAAHHVRRQALVDLLRVGQVEVSHQLDKLCLSLR